MGLYTLSSFMTTIKEDIGIKDIELPVTDNELIDRFDRSALTKFSIVYPRMERCLISEDNLTKQSKLSNHMYYEYRIPEFAYYGTTILSVTNIDVARPNGYSDFYIPNANWNTPDAIIAAMADIRQSAGLSSALAKAPTCEFREPDTVRVFNGWSGGIYEIEILLKHDLSLASVPNGAMMDLMDLATLDMKAYLYNKLKRKNQLDVGVGNIQLNIDDWSNAEQDMRELLRTWREDCNFDFDHIKYF